jgi:hypothetical protein
MIPLLAAASADFISKNVGELVVGALALGAVMVFVFVKIVLPMLLRG